MWRAFDRKAFFDLCQIHVAARGKTETRLDALEDLVKEPTELVWAEEFLAIMQDTF